MKHMCRALSSWPLIKMSGDATTGAEEPKPGPSRPNRGSSAALNSKPVSAPIPAKHKPCCLCWCCCCSCSCITGAPAPKPSPLDPDDPFYVEQTEPSVDDVESWAESFDKLMQHPVGRKLFRDFLCCEYSEENILFWKACEDLKRETEKEIIIEKARIIYEEFVSVLSPREISLDAYVREIVNCNMANPSTASFDEAQLQIYTLMQRDSYPRFVNSAMYKGYVAEQKQEVGCRHC